MEPCLFRHGKGYDDRPDDDPEDASMEPCLFRHGKIDTTCSNTGISRGLQWSHVFSDMVSKGTSLAGARYCRFNGAMSFQTW